MNKFKSLFLHFLFLLLITLPIHSADSPDQNEPNSRYPHYFGIGNIEDTPPWDVWYVPAPKPIPQYSNHALVPDSFGNPQGIEAFKLLFAGQEDLKTVRIRTKIPVSHYTFREKLKVLLSGRELPEYYLSGTITSHGILTNGHGFVEKVPSISNAILDFFGSKNHLYRKLEPVEVEQGLTLKPFETEDIEIYHDPSAIIPPSMYSVHATFTQKKHSICLHSL